MRWACVYGGCLFVFFGRAVRLAALVFLRLFLYFIFLDGFLMNLSDGIKIFLLYFCLLLLMPFGYAQDYNCSLPAVTADQRPPLRPWLAG